MIELNRVSQPTVNNIFRFIKLFVGLCWIK